MVAFPTAWGDEMMQLFENVLRLFSNRKLSYLTIGKGKEAVIWCHGLPSSRLEAMLLKPLANTCDVRIIGFDRPGFGISTFTERNCIGEYVEDVEALANALSLETFKVAGWSGGGPLAIACAAYLPKRVSTVVVLGGCAVPFIPYSLDPSVVEWTLWGLETSPLFGTYIQKKMRSALLKMAEDPEAYLNGPGKKFVRQFAKDDIAKLQTPSMERDIIMQSVKEAYRQGDVTIKAILQETRLLKEKWLPFDLERIQKDVLHVWHGIDDKNVPLVNAIQNFGTIPTANIRLFRGGHSFFLGNLPDLAKTLRIT
jgi:pimeloyl-ACP methyl ester carboxylesterase